MQQILPTKAQFSDRKQTVSMLKQTRQVPTSLKNQNCY